MPTSPSPSPLTAYVADAPLNAPRKVEQEAVLLQHGQSIADGVCLLAALQSAFVGLLSQFVCICTRRSGNEMK